jgi:hypothetical protein
VLHDDGGLAQPATRTRISNMLAKVETQSQVASVADPFAAGGSISSDGDTAYATVALDAQAADVPVDDVRAIIHTAQQAATDGLQVELGGDLMRGAAGGGGGASEGAGMLAALVILVFLFGSLLAAIVPLLTAVFAVGSTLGFVVLASHLFTRSRLHRARDDAGGARRRHRLCVADLLAVPQRAPEGCGTTGGSDNRTRYNRPLGAVRRLHRGDRPAGVACTRPRLVARGWPSASP